MDVIVEFAEGFIGLFKAGAETLVGNITGILPLLAVIITVLNAFLFPVMQRFPFSVQHHFIYLFCNNTPA